MRRTMWSHRRLALASPLSSGDWLSAALPEQEATESVTIPSGQVFYHGNPLVPDGCFNSVVRTDTAVVINGTPVLVAPRRRSGSDGSGSPLVSLYRETNETMDRLFREGRSPEQISGAVAEAYGESPLVRQVRGSGTPILQVTFKDGFLLELPIVRLTSPERPGASAQIQRWFELYAGLLRQDCLIFIGEVDYYVPPLPEDRFRAVREEIVLAQGGSPECLTADGWHGRHLPLEIARDLRAPRPLNGRKELG